MFAMQPLRWNRHSLSQVRATSDSLGDIYIGGAQRQLPRSFKKRVEPATKASPRNFGGRKALGAQRLSVNQMASLIVRDGSHPQSLVHDMMRKSRDRAGLTGAEETADENEMSLRFILMIRCAAGAWQRNGLLRGAMRDSLGIVLDLTGFKLLDHLG